MNKAKFICSHCVRRIACERCRYYAECSKGEAPVSQYARYLSRLDDTLQQVEATLRRLSGDARLRVCFGVPDDGEIREGAYAVVRVYRAFKRSTHLICRIPLSGREEMGALRYIVFNAYREATRQKKGQK